MVCVTTLTLLKMFTDGIPEWISCKLTVLCLFSQRAVERAECTGREELGVEVYSVQHELARLQANLEGQHESNMQMATQRRQAQEQLEGVRCQYQTTIKQTGQQRKCGKERCGQSGVVVMIYGNRSPETDL